MLAELHALPIGERIQLVEDIWDSIAADQALLPLTDEQRTELDRRLDAYESDNMRGSESSEVVAALKKRLSRPKQVKYKIRRSAQPDISCRVIMSCV